MANTPNYGLYKPDRKDTTVEVDTSLTTNFNIIDTEMKKNKDDLTTHINNQNAHTSANVSHADGSVKSTLENHETRISNVESGGTTRIQGKPVPAPISADDEKLIAYDYDTDSFKYVAPASGGGAATPVDDNLNSTSVINALSSNQGRVLKSLVDGKAPIVHAHAITDVTNLQASLDDKSNILHNHDDAYAPLAHIHTIANVTNLQNALDGKSPTGHTHTIAQVTNLQTTLDAKALATHNHDTTYAPLTHTHTTSQVTGLDTALAGKASTAAVTTSVNGLMIAADKSKLDGVATGANNYVHPANHSPSIITQDASNRFVTDAEKTNWNGKMDKAVTGTGVPSITPSYVGQLYIDTTAKEAYMANGLTAGDWQSISMDEIGSGGTSVDWAAVTGKPTVFKPDTTDTTLVGLLNAKADDSEITTINNSLAGKASTAVVTTSANGLMISTDKSKLDGIAAGANNYVHPANHSPSIITQDASNRFVTDAEKGAWNGKLDASANAVSATKLATARTLSVSGDIAGSASFDGTVNANITATLPNVVIAGTGTKINYNAKGQVTGSSPLAAGDIPDISATYATSGHTHTTAQVSGLDTALAGKASTSHTHTTAQVTGLDTALAGKASTALATTSTDGLMAAADKTTINNLASTYYDKATSDGRFAPKVLTGAGVPSSVPTAVGLVYIDTTNTEAYMSTGTSSSADWESISMDELGSTGAGADWSVITNKPTTLSGYGITDAGTKAQQDTNTGNISTLTSGKADKATTLLGYGITDAVNTSQVVTVAAPDKILKLNASSQLPASITGSAATLSTARTIAATGDVVGTATSFNGSANISIPTTLASVGTAGTYTKVTTDAKGRVISGSGMVASDIPDISATYATKAHIHATSEITGLDTALAGKASTALATNSINGLMSSSDKTKLDGLSQVTQVAVENVLTSTSTTNALSANMGKTLNTSVAGNTTEITNARGTFPALKDRLDDVDSKFQGVTWSGLQYPIYMAHRGARNVFPEASIEAFRGCVALGMQVIEMDIQVTSDGVLVVSHDDTMDRTTDKVGDISTRFTAMGFKNAKIDILPGWTGSTVVFEDLIREFGNKVVYAPEIKDSSGCIKLVDMIIKYKLEKNCIIQSFSAPSLDYAISKGIPTLYLKSVNDVTPATVLSWGINHVGISSALPDQYVTDMLAAGLKVFIYTINRRVDKAKYAALGVHGYFSDDPMWINETAPVSNYDTFPTQTFTYGQICPTADGTMGGDRGTFVSPNKFGWPVESLKRDFSMQGWAGKLSNAFTLDVKITYADVVSSVRWASVAFCTPNDFYDDQNASGPVSDGYHVLLRESGSLELFIRQNSTSTLLTAALPTAAIVQGQVVPFRIQVTATQLIITRVDTSHSITVNNTVFRGGYLHFGRNLLGALFEDAVLTRQ